IVLHVVAHNQREIPIEGTPIDFMNLYCDAWNVDPSQRPTISEIRNKLDNIGTEAVDSVHYNEHNKHNINISNDKVIENVISIG
ncbi:4224_t:CDS:1, partial [Cetraspora pellucida]